MRSVIWANSRSAHDAEYQAKLSRLEAAEAEVADLRARAERAIKTLEDRRKRNHWRESIQEMLGG